MPSTSPMQTESELQWDPDSAPEQPYNCGPSSAEKVANFYKDLFNYGIEKTRNLGSTRHGTGTNTLEQKKMLDSRGIPSQAIKLTAAQVKDKLKSGRRPFIIWMIMSYVPQAVKGNTYLHWHALSALSNGIVNGETGIWINEPNQHRDRSTYKKVRFFPDKYWMPASKAAGGWCIVPDKDKIITTRSTLSRRFRVMEPILNVRSAPTRTAMKVRPPLTVGNHFISNLLEVAGGSYINPAGRTSRRWIGLKVGTRQAWVAADFVREI